MKPLKANRKLNEFQILLSAPFQILLFGAFNSGYVGGAAIDECAELSWQSVCVCVCELPLVLCLSLPVCESLAAVHSMMNGLEKSKHNRNACA